MVLDGGEEGAYTQQRTGWKVGRSDAVRYAGASSCDMSGVR